MITYGLRERKHSFPLKNSLENKQKTPPGRRHPCVESMKLGTRALGT